jgi:6-phosphogluconolactonase
MNYKTNIFTTKSEMLDELAFALVRYIQDTLQNQKIFRLVIGGGRTQEDLNSRMVAIKNPKAFWNNVFIFLSDERCVPLDHEQSNFRMNVDTLVVPSGLPGLNIFGYPTELGPEKAVAKYCHLIQKMPRYQDNSLFDLSLLGLGPDGHTASLFPGSPALDELKNPAAAAGYGPEGLPRVTLTYPALNSSRKIWIMATGKEKNPPVSQMLNGPYEPATCPVQGIRPESGDITLWLDADAAPQQQQLTNN